MANTATVECRNCHRPLAINITTGELPNTIEVDPVITNNWIEHFIQCHGVEDIR